MITSENGKVNLNELEKQTQAVVKGGNKKIDIYFGAEPQADADDVPPKDLWSLPYSGDGKTYLVQPGDTLSTIAIKEYGKQRFYVADSKMDMPEPFHRAFEEGVPLYYFFPLIVLATYKKRQSDKSFFVDTAAPENIQISRNLCIPQLTIDSAKDLIGDKTVADIFRLYVDYYKGTGQDFYAPAFQDIYMYLTYGSK